MKNIVLIIVLLCSFMSYGQTRKEVKGIELQLKGILYELNLDNNYRIKQINAKFIGAYTESRKEELICFMLKDKKNESNSIIILFNFKNGFCISDFQFDTSLDEKNINYLENKIGFRFDYCGY